MSRDRDAGFDLSKKGRTRIVVALNLMARSMIANDGTAGRKVTAIADCPTRNGLEVDG